MTHMVATPSVPLPNKVLHGLTDDARSTLFARYQRLLPSLLLLLSPEDIAERNRTWSGASPKGKAATKFLTAREAAVAREVLYEYSRNGEEATDELWLLFRAYCRYGPIGLLDALSSDEVPAPNELQELAQFHRLAKHPRAEPGLYIRSLMNDYADALGVPRLSPFVQRYLWSSDRKIERWYIGEGHTTEGLTKTTKRQNLRQTFPHQAWRLHHLKLPTRVRFAARNPALTQPELLYLVDTTTEALMGVYLCPGISKLQDVFLALRWSIWHFDSPWWPHRGCPTRVVLPSSFANCNFCNPALYYLQIRMITGNEAAESNKIQEFNKLIIAWASAIKPVFALQTLIEQLAILLSDYHNTTQARPTPAWLLEEGASLPWSNGIAAVQLLPSAGRLQVLNDKILPFGIPYTLNGALPESSLVDVRFDPMDARRVWCIQGNACVVVAYAAAFEHKTTWYELVVDLNLTLLADSQT